MAGIGVQAQIRHNAEDIRNYFEDLRKWEKEMKDKEKQQNKTRHTAVEALKENLTFSQQKTPESPPSAAQKKPSSPRERNRKLARDENSLPAYYSAWERFDVDEELEKIDRESAKDPGLITASSKAPPLQTSRHTPKNEAKQHVSRSKMKVQTRTCRRHGATQDNEALPVRHSPKSVTFEEDNQMQLLSKEATEAETNVRKALLLNLSGIEQFRQKNLRSAWRAFQLAFAAMGQRPISCNTRCDGTDFQLSAVPKPAVFRHFAKLQSVILSNDGFAQLGLARAATALERAKEAKKLWPESPFVAFLEASCSRRQGDYAAAIERLISLEKQMQHSQRSQATCPAQSQSARGDSTTEESLTNALQPRETTEQGKTTKDAAAEDLKNDSLDAFDKKNWDSLSFRVAIYHPDSPEQTVVCSGTVGGTEASVLQAATGDSSSLAGIRHNNAGADQERSNSPSFKSGNNVSNTNPEQALATVRNQESNMNNTLAHRLKENIEELRALQRERQVVARQIRQQRFYEETVEIFGCMKKLRQENEEISPLLVDTNQSSKDATPAHGAERPALKDGRKRENGKTAKRKCLAHTDAIARALVSTPTRNLSILFLEPRNDSRQTSICFSTQGGEVDPVDGGKPAVEVTKSVREPNACRKGEVEEESRAPQMPRESVRGDSSQEQHAKHYLKSGKEDTRTILSSGGARRLNGTRRQDPIVSTPSTPPLPVTFFSFVQQWSTKCRHHMYFKSEERDGGIDASTRIDSVVTEGIPPENRGIPDVSGVTYDEGRGERAQFPSSAEAAQVGAGVVGLPVESEAKPVTRRRIVCRACATEKGTLLERLATAGVIGRLFGASLEADVLSQILRVLLDLLDASSAKLSSEIRANPSGLNTCEDGHATVPTATGVTNWSLPRVKRVTAEVLTQLSDGQARFWSLLYQLEPEELACLEKAVVLCLGDVTTDETAGKTQGEPSAFSNATALSGQTPGRTSLNTSAAQKRKLLEQLHHRISTLTSS
ncbi:hypothetical protein TGGT1_217630 [Toxoplasma gondii GT1]|uniref:Tetratricopeptide repeat-containing protein n=3 Tax=Toxoplasma gondii TaxID=5811 RepID=S7WAB3_TOXGG|nr:hypothetical protein TGGT1_217630 [Toxoplasma gondii GT1]KAF4638348.1 hypothetical protein TGRH88_059550 [Toxoplasma gondii]RQX71829.1 hypothetical protein TGCAST_217630 [Toxoplasma gondii CAST]